MPRHLDSVEKIITRYFACLTKVPFSYRDDNYAPKPLIVSPLLLRGYLVLSVAAVAVLDSRLTICRLKTSQWVKAYGKDCATVPKVNSIGPHLRFAYYPKGEGDINLRRSCPERAKRAPALLVSYVFLKRFLEHQDDYVYRDYMMDSGAYSVYRSGAEIDLEEYIDHCKLLAEIDPTLVEIIALDVIGSGEGSLKNAWTMKKAGVDAVPVFHFGEDFAILKEYCKHWSKVGLSCRFGESLKKSYWFYDQCFARHWPKKFHSFGWTGDKMLMQYPFHSADTTSWRCGPSVFGRWKAFGGEHIPIRGQRDIGAEVEWWLDFEERIQDHWKKEMLLLSSF